MTNLWTTPSPARGDPKAQRQFQPGSPRKRMLFVDDEPTVLELFRIMFEPMKQQWEVITCGSGAEALALFEKQPFEVVVSDLRMPGMSGLDLLGRIMRQYPQTARFILSGFSDQEEVARLMGTVHQFLLKPCDLLTLTSTLSRVCSLDVFLHNDALKRLASQMTTLPSVPSVYFQLLKELQSPEASTEKIGELVMQDPSLSAKLLHLVNSAFFGISRKIANPNEAVQLLGINTIRSLALCAHTFSCFEESKVQAFSIKGLWNHCLATGRMAQHIARLAQAGVKVMEEALIAGLLHDLGVMMFSFNLPKQYKEVVAIMEEKQVGRWQAETEVFGATHADLGAYLLGLWGLPVPIVEAVALHHHPFRVTHRDFSPLTAVHLANFFDHKPSNATASDQASVQLDMAYLQEVGITEKISDWHSEVAAPNLSEAA